jgi:fimbrial chaperone protein
MRILLASALLAACGSVYAADAGQAGITISPISISLDAKRPADAVTFSNGTTENKVIQVEVMNWSHENGEDHFSPATDLLVSPPMFRVAAGAKQVVRVGLKSRAGANSATEKTYRMFLQEVPETAPVTAVEGGGSALRLLLRFGVPVFLKPTKALPESISWKASRNKDNSIALSVTNTSNRHLRVSEVKLESAGKSVAANNFAYVFAGETYTWTLKPDTAWQPGAAMVSARTDDGSVHAGLSLQGP